MKLHSPEESTIDYIGGKRTLESDQINQIDTELTAELGGHLIKKIRRKRNLTQSQLGEILGVKKAQISKLENSLSNARLDTILKVFTALNAKVTFKVELLSV